MAWTALLVLACLVAPHPEASGRPSEASPGTGERMEPSAEAEHVGPSAEAETDAGHGSNDAEHDAGHGSNDAAEPVEGSVSQPPTPAPASEPPRSDASTSADPALPLVDPWASVPVQSVVPGALAPAAFARSDRTRAVSAPLLDPWAGAAGRHVPRRLDPELRDPFHALQRHHGPRIARADLRDPFALRSSSPGPSAPVQRAVAAEPATPSPDLRDPFGRRDARPVPPAPEAAPAPAPRPPAPPSGLAPVPPSPRAGAVLPGSRPFAHLPRARRPA